MLRCFPLIFLACFGLARAADWMEVSQPHAQIVRPAEGATVQQTPPDFSWPDAAGDARYEVTLTYPDGRRRTLSAPQNFLNWDEVLPPGEYAWEVKLDGSRASRARKFRVNAESKPFLVPDMAQLAARLKAKPHPRGLPDEATLRTMARQRPQAIAALRAEVDNRARAPLPPEPSSPSSGKDNSQLFDEVKRAQNALAAYALTREERYYAEALRRVRNLASWDPKGATAYSRHGMTMSARTATFILILGYDWLHPKLDAATKELLLNSIAARLGQMHGDVIGNRSRVAKHPRDSHGQLTASMLGMMSTLVVGDIPQAEGWMSTALPLALNLTQPWGGEDGGFANGVPYGVWDTGDLLPHWYVLRWASGIDLAQKAWVRNYARFLAYFNPPGTPTRPFGDGHEQPMLAEHSARFGKGYTHFAPSPLGRWYASRLSGEGALRFEYVMSPPADFDGARPLPPDTPRSIHLPSIGWVAMHSDLADERRTSVYFKSSPPPFGAFNHQHADQNGFVVNAGGQPLAIESGYYDGYKSPHWWKWLHQTRAKNAITYDGGKGQVFFEQDNRMGTGAITRFSAGPDYDIATGDATAAYAGALTRAQRTLVYLRPNLLVVRDRLASATPRRWEWNIHAVQKMKPLSERRIQITNGNQTLCIEMHAGPPVAFSQTDAWTAPPLRGEPQWHGVFVTAPLAEAELVAVLDVGCSATPAQVERVVGLSGESTASR